ncbi:hypothetical protein KP509_18G072100 [Ceratopteris richardii]|nr:hypothetical protein KP509_18G072100 [Ceratopteris richardii]
MRKHGGHSRMLINSPATAGDSKLGSRPPSCKSKCRGCLPCSPVEVTVPPAQHDMNVISSSYVATTNSYLSPYYSVAWRCRCRGKDYNP